MKRNEAISRNPIYETFCVIIGAYFSYALAHLDFFQLSGDVAIFFYGLVMSHYNKYNLSLESFKSIGLSFNLMMQLSEAVCFIYIGLSFEDAIRGHSENFIYAGTIMLILLICRSFVVAGMALIKRDQKNFRVHGGEWVAAVSSCLVKGPLAYIFMNILLPGIPECINVFDHHHYAVAYPLFVMQVYVVGSLLILHPINYLVFRCAVAEKLHEGDDIDIKLERAREHKEKLLDDNWVVDKDRPKVFAYADEFLLKPFLIRDYHQRKDQINQMKKIYDDLAVHYDHGLHLEHEIHEIHHRMCDPHEHESHGEGHHGHHGEGSHGHHDEHNASDFKYTDELNHGSSEIDVLDKRKTAKSEFITLDQAPDDITSNSEILKEEEQDVVKDIVFDSMATLPAGPE